MIPPMSGFDRERLRSLIKERGTTPRALSGKLGNNPYLVRDILNSKSQNPRSDTIAKIAEALGVSLKDLMDDAESHIGNQPDLPEVDPTLDYVSVEVLPTFAGMGGGGTGDGDASRALVSRSLVVQELRADPADLLLIDVRGDSMLDPATGKGFMHGDQLLIHRRDTNPRQPGPFALWYDDGYVVKNVEIIRATGKLRIFSNNPAYSDDQADPDEVKIMGRPVWFARRL